MFRPRWGLRHVGAWIATVATVALCLPALASAATPTTLEIGPLKSAHGYSFDLTVEQCAGTSSTEFDYSRGSADNNIDYAYTGSGTCSAAASLRRAHLDVSWPGIATANLKVIRVGAARRVLTPPGCRGGRGTTRAVVLGGTLKISASKAFGTIRLRRVVAYLSRISGLDCKTPTIPKATNFFAEFGQAQSIIAERPTRGDRFAYLEDDFSPATGVSGTLSVTVTGAKAKVFSLTKTGGTLSAAPFARGRLTLTTLPRCIGNSANAENVTLGGSLTIRSAVLGPVVFNPAGATTATLGADNAFPGQCNGYGSTPLTPAVDQYCDSAAAGCSVSLGSNQDTFTDVSQPGTQSIVSETITFGDGSTGTFSNGSVTHTYAKPGTYTAQVTIETDNGQTQTVSTTVYIEA